MSYSTRETIQASETVGESQDAQKQAKIAEVLDYSRLNREDEMCLKPMPIPAIPEPTIAVARAVYPNGNLFMQIRDMFDSIYNDDVFVDLYPPDGQPALTP